MVSLQPQSQSTLKMEWYHLVSCSFTQQTFSVSWEVMHHLSLVLIAVRRFRENRYRCFHFKGEKMKAKEVLH